MIAVYIITMTNVNIHLFINNITRESTAMKTNATLKHCYLLTK